MALTQLLDVPAPAKLNLFLHVVGRRPDGYHLLQSVFMLIDWCDTLHFELRRDGRIQRHDSHGADLPSDDLCVRAATVLKQASGCTLGIDITLDKHIPMQAGLGGGSSDAATTLLALNHLWGLHWPTERLIGLGMQLGADVPFFLGGRNAWVEGIGEQLTPVNLPESRFLVLKPPAGVSTPEIFKHPALNRQEKRHIIEDFLAIDARELYRWGSNNLQPVAQRLCPDISAGLAWFSQQGLQARMTGSGSALFAPLQADADLSKVPAGWDAKICKNLRLHPLIEQKSG